MSPGLEAWSLNHWTVCPGKSCMSLEECLFRTYTYVLIVCVFFFYTELCELYLYILEINSLSVAAFANIFSHSVGCLLNYT